MDFDIIIMKKCRRCKNHKEHDEYDINKQNNNKLFACCKKCRKQNVDLKDKLQIEKN
jgi:hypothetical protein